MTLPERALRTIRKHGLVPRGGRVVVALSGGPDSVALVHVLRDLEADGELSVVGLAHFNHALRGAASDEDERFCRELAPALGLAFESERGDVRAFAREQRRSIEDAARALRYAFLERAADRFAADAIAVGHTLDDQAETFLLRLIRGAGPRGLGGIRPRAGRVVRPLLEISRAEVRSFVTERGLAFRADATNDDIAIPRNRIRHELIPYLEREFSPGITKVLAREAAIARDDEDQLQSEAIKLSATVVLCNTAAGNGIELDAEALRLLPAALASRVARIALETRAGGRFIGSDHVDRFLEFVRSGRAGALSLPGQCARLRVASRRFGPSTGSGPSRAKSRDGEAGSVVVLTPSGSLERRADIKSPPRRSGFAAAEGNAFRFPLSIPGEVILAPQGWAVSAEPFDGGPPAGSWHGAPDAVVVASPALRLPLAVRNRRPGDRFRPFGMTGGKKLQDFLVDRKIPRETRDSLPLVVDAADRIVWVVGQSVAEDFRITEPSTGVILLKARRLGGQG